MYFINEKFGYISDEITTTKKEFWLFFVSAGFKTS